MRVQCLFVFLVLVLGLIASHAQQARRLYVGPFADVHLGHVSQADYSVGSGSVGRYVVRAFGLGAGAVGLYELSRRWSIWGSLSYVKDVVQSTTTYNGVSSGGGQLTSQVEDAVGYSWIDFSPSLFYKPIEATSYSIMAGTGISVRYLGKATVKSDLSATYDISDAMYSWNYFLPLEAGVELPAGYRGKLVFLAGFQFGLRRLYRPPDPNGAFDYAFFDNSQKLHSITFKVAYMIGVPDRTAVK